MKELDDFTVERLQAITQQPDSSTIFMYEVRALARIALAAKTAEPVTWWTGPVDEMESFHDHETGSHQIPLVPGLYSIPVLNSPELPDGWIPCAERMPEIGELVLIYTRHIEMIVAALDSDGFFATSDGTCYHPGSVVLWQPAPTPPTTEK